jgi:hypothetical protein
VALHHETSIGWRGAAVGVRHARAGGEGQRTVSSRIAILGSLVLFWSGIFALFRSIVL